MLIAVVFLEVWWAPNPPRNSSPGPGNGFTGWGSPPGRNFQWYVSHGQLKADARTALAMLEYVLSPERDLWAAPVVAPPAPFLSATTNSGTNVPRV